MPTSFEPSALTFLRFDVEVEWATKHQFLKFEAPVDIRSDVAYYESAFGVTTRNSNFNTPWDAAKFEVCGHRFADLSEFDYGVALLNDCKYGYAVAGLLHIGANRRNPV